MNPETKRYSNAKQTNSRKKLWFIVGGIVLLVAVVVVILFIAFGKETPQNKGQNNDKSGVAAEDFEFSARQQPITYAGHQVYDACNLISFETLKKAIPNFTKLLNTVGTEERASNPLVIQHEYIDRDIAEPLGNDAQPRPKGTVVNVQDGVVNADPYILLSDSNCGYGQASDQTFLQSSTIDSTFAHLYITQKPTPLSQDFLSFIVTQQKFTDHNFKDIDIYATPNKDSNGYYTGVYVKKDQSAAAILKTGIAELFDEASDDIAAMLSNPPTGPLNVTYPKPYETIQNPCNLFSADDFTRFTGKPTGALASESMLLTEVGNNSVRRECERLEIDRDVLDSNIARSKVTLTQARSSNDARNFMEAEKRNSLYTTTPLKARIALGDEAFIKKKESVSELRNPYSIVIRKGATVVTIEIGLDKQHASTDEFEGNIIPVAQSVLKKLDVQN